MRECSLDGGRREGDEIYLSSGEVWDVLVVFGECHEADVFFLGIRHGLLREHARAVGAEIEEEDAVVVVDRITGAFLVEEHDRFEVLVDDALRVEFLDNFGRFARSVFRRAFAVKDRLLDFFESVPVVVTVHGIETSGGGGDETDAKVVDHILEFFEIGGGAFRSGVAAVGEGMNGDSGDTGSLGSVEESIEMLRVAVDAARREQAFDMQYRVVFFDMIEQRDEGGIGDEFVVADGFGDADQVGVDDRACADGHVAHLAVAHLSFGQTDASGAGVQERVRVGFPQVVEERCLGLGDGVVLSVFAVSPAVEYDEEVRFLGLHKIGRE